MSKVVRPTGIIRTLPYFGAAVTGGEMRDSSNREAMQRAYKRMMSALRNLVCETCGEVGCSGDCSYDAPDYF